MNHYTAKKGYNDLKPVDSDRGEFIFYSPADYLVAEDRQQFHGKRDDDT
jgi:hypothetical protein